MVVVVGGLGEMVVLAEAVEAELVVPVEQTSLQG